MIKAVFATDLANGFGNKGGLPWPPIPEDFKHFKDVTMGCYVVMGHKTYKSIPCLPGRFPIIVTSRESTARTTTTYDNLIERLDSLSDATDTDAVLIGGSSILTLEYLEDCDEIYHTTVLGVYDSDIQIPDEVMSYLNTLEEEILLETDKCIIRKYH